MVSLYICIYTCANCEGTLTVSRRSTTRTMQSARALRRVAAPGLRDSDVPSASSMPCHFQMKTVENKTSTPRSTRYERERTNTRSTQPLRVPNLTPIRSNLLMQEMIMNAENDSCRTCLAKASSMTGDCRGAETKGRGSWPGMYPNSRPCCTTTALREEDVPRAASTASLGFTPAVRKTQIQLTVEERAPENSAQERQIQIRSSTFSSTMEITHLRRIVA